MRRYYFEIKGLNVIRCVQASSLTEARALAAERWLPFWRQITWVNE